MKIFTDLLLIKGNFTKITLCIYGNLVKDEATLSQRCPNYLANAPIEPIMHNMIQMYFMFKVEKKTFFNRSYRQSVSFRHQQSNITALSNGPR